MRLLLSGGSGLIGKNLIRLALKEGYQVNAIVRDPEHFKMLPENQIFKWTHQEDVPLEAFKDVGAIVHLSGENIAGKRWSKEQKARLINSRIIGTRNLVKALSKIPSEKRPKVLISGSAIGYYGYERDEELNEKSKSGQDFLANLCRDWENEALAAEKLGIRVVLLRTGIVLSREGGALSKMPPIQVLDGKAWMSWIHIQDMVRAILFALNNESLSGPINCVSTNPVQNKEFVQGLAQAKGIPTFGFIPKVVLSLALGELSNAVTSSLRVQPNLLLTAGFKFQFPRLKEALDYEFKGTNFFDAFLFKDQFVPLKPEEIFHFFSRAENLETLTPPWLNFKIVSKSNNEIEKGSLIDYKLKIHGVPVKWKTLIAEWKKNDFFIDEQLKGPYSKWHHLHTFEPVPGGTLLRDEVTYRVPFAILGNLFIGSWISRDVGQIFKFRQEKIQNLIKAGELI